MKKIMAIIAGLSLLTLIIIIGCDTRTPSGTTNPPVTQVADVELQVPSEFKAPAGLLEVTVTALVTNSEGVGVSDVAVEFSLNPSIGSIAPIDSLTDQFGLMEAKYTVILDTASVYTQVTAKVTNTTIEDTKTLTINLLDEEIQSVTLDATEPVLYLGTEVSVTDTLIATVIDNNSMGISGLLVNFSTNNQYGSITNVDTTNQAGQVITTIRFSSSDIPSDTNAISTWVYASVGNERDSTQITVIRQASTAAYVQITADPSYMLLAEGSQGTSNLYCVVTDINGNGVPGITVYLAATPSEGVNITAPDPTDASGETSTTIKSFARDDTVFVTATVNLTGQQIDTTITDETSIIFAHLEAIIDTINVWAEPPVLTVSPGASAASTIYARVLDSTNTAIKDLQLTFASEKGALTSPNLTDSTGVSMVTFFSNGDTGIIKIWATAGDVTDTTTVTVNQSGSTTGSITISSDKDTIYADGDVTFATIRAVLKNADNEPISGDTVHFTSTPPWTQIVSPRITDSTGTATSIFNDIGPDFCNDPGVPSIITVKYDPLGLDTFCTVMIMPPPNVDTILISSPASAGMEANGTDTTFVTAKVYMDFASNTYAPVGTAITFSTTLGTVVPTDTVIGTGGQAVVKFVSSTVLDTAIVTATCQGVESNPPLYIPFHPGPPTDLVLSSIVPEVLKMGNPDSSTATITVTVQDTIGHGVANQQVSWTTTLGTITALSITNQDGHAIAYLSAQTQAGVAQVTAYTPGVQDTLSFGVPIESGQPSSIQLTSNFNSIQVQGTGGQESATLTASVFDGNGNPIYDGVRVDFHLLPPTPLDALFDNGLYYISAYTSSGQSMVSLNSGYTSGAVTVEAVTWMNWPDTTVEISAIKSNIIIASGPPYNINVDYGDEAQPAEGTNTFGCALKIPVNARVVDSLGNNVSAGTAVFFTVTVVDPGDLSIWYNPDHAHIYPSAIIQDTSGIAYTFLYFNSEDTYCKVDIVAQCNRPDSSIAQDVAYAVELPLYGGTLELSVTPQAWYFGGLCVMRVSAVLFDDFLYPINNARITFSNSMGMFFNADSAEAAVTTLPNQWYTNGHWRFDQYTGPNPIDSINYYLPEGDFHQYDGEAKLFMRAEEVENVAANPDYPGVFLDALTPTTIGEVNAELAGSNISTDPVNVTFNRVP